jgi:hypothetical protein
MAATMNKEARRLKSRTYEGVQWFDHGWGVWVAAVPGTNLAVMRNMDVYRGKTQCNAWVVVPVEGEDPDEWPLALNRNLPRVHFRGNVKSVSRDVQVLRAFIERQSPFDFLKVVV